MTLTVGSLFSGIGGIDLGLERAGMRVVWQAETDPYASKVLAKHWPAVPNLGDVTKIDWENDELLGDDGIARSLHVDLICGGYPCQPFSLAGGRAGTSDARHLWPYFANALRLLRPRWALLENVPGHLSLGFADVLADLAALGFDAEWDLLPAAAVGAPHLRYRIFVVAHTQSDRPPQQPETRSAPSCQAGSAHPTALLGGGARAGSGAARGNPSTGIRLVGGATTASESNVADPERPGPQGHRREHQLREASEKVEARRCSDEGDTDSSGRERLVPTGLAPEQRQRRAPERSGAELADSDRPVRGSAWGAGQPIFGPETLQRPRRCSCCDGDHWAVEPGMGRVAHGVPSRMDRLRCLGNAVVPQVAEYVGRLLLEAEEAAG